MGYQSRPARSLLVLPVCTPVPSHIAFTCPMPTDRHEPCTNARITGIGISTTHMISKTLVRVHRG